MDDFEKELKLGFLEEAKQAAADVEQCFLTLGSASSEEDNLNKIFRLAHNLKGSSKAVGFNEFGEFTHEFESFILRIKNKEIQATPLVVNLLLRANDHVREMIDGLIVDLDAKFNSTELIFEMQNFSDIELPDDAQVGEAMAALEPAKTPTTERVKNAAAPADDSLRVSLSKIEHLVNAVGEMVILQSGLKEQAQLLNSPALKRIVQHLSKVSKEIQESSMSLRMVPIKPVFQKMQRIVRDTSQALKKDIEFKVEGENTDIDKTILEKIGDPLVHLIRNSVDHGIEASDVRINRGKNSKGTVVLRALHQSGRLIIEVSDDGGGLDPEKIKKKAIEKGILSIENKLSDKEACRLIFAPGFSTKEQVTDVSGRGVGLDVVKTNIQELGGEVIIDSAVGKGTVFKIVLPLTLAIVDAMTLTYGEEKFVIPINQVYETLKITGDLFKESSIGYVLLLRDENLPLFRLGDFFGIRSQKKNTEMIAIVVRSAVRSFAFLVDDIIGQSQAVLKQLGPELQGIVGICGSTILPDGKPALIIEAQDLLKRNLSI